MASDIDRRVWRGIFTVRGSLGSRDMTSFSCNGFDVLLLSSTISLEKNLTLIDFYQGHL